MRTTEVKRLLDAFYRGETTLEEEAALRAWFESGAHSEDGDLDPRLETDRQLFMELYSDPAASETEADKQPLSGASREAAYPPSELRMRIAAEIDSREVQSRRRSIVYRMMVPAAAAVLLMALFFINPFSSDPAGPNGMQPLASHQDTYDDPMEAYEEALRALAYVSGKFSKGTDALQDVAESSKSGMENLKLLEKMDAMSIVK